MYKKVEAFYEPENILDLLSERCSEMTRDQRAFLGGLIKEKKPKKIVEVGVAAGATTCIILNCLEMMKNVFAICKTNGVTD